MCGCLYAGLLVGCSKFAWCLPHSSVSGCRDATLLLCEGLIVRCEGRVGHGTCQYAVLSRRADSTSNTLERL